MSSPAAAPRTLLVAPNWVGDCVMAEPVFRALAASGREIVVLAKRPLHGLLALFPGVVAAIDNLIKGASGQAIQCFNVAAGLPETMGLI